MNSTESMDVPTLQGISCPHCYEENPLFGTQRCNACHLNMFSDQEFRLHQQILQPNLMRLDEDLHGLAESPQSLAYLRSIQPLIGELIPLSEQREWLANYLEKVEAFLSPYQQALDRYKKQFAIHLLFFFVLLMAPAMAFLLGADGMISGLLFLPVLGWGYLGIWQYTKPLRHLPKHKPIE